MPHNSLLVKLPSAFSNNQLRVSVFTASGKRIYSSSVKSVNDALSLSSMDFPAGMYFLNVSDERKSLSVSFFLTK
jgi:hypothetical protein